MTEVARQNYPDRDTLMRGLAELVADQLRAAHATKHRATLCVPGGSTPVPFFQALSESDLNWGHVDVLPNDERQVPVTSARSNTRLIAEHLLQGNAAAAHLISLAEEGGADAAVEAALPIDVLVLGMGADMHTASLFPRADGLDRALEADAPVTVTVRPADQPEARTTLAARVLRAASVIHILIVGSDKARALEAALGPGEVADAPIRAILTAPAPVTVHYAD